MKRCSGPVTVTLVASIWRQFGVERLPGYMISARAGTEVLEMQASTIRLILLLAFTVAVVAAAFALTRGFYIETAVLFLDDGVRAMLEALPRDMRAGSCGFPALSSWPDCPRCASPT